MSISSVLSVALPRRCARASDGARKEKTRGTRARLGLLESLVDLLAEVD